MKKIDWNSLLRKDMAFVYAIRINQSRFALCPGIGWSSLFYPFAGEKRGDETAYPTLKRKTKSHTDCEDLDNTSDKKYAYSAIKISFIDLLLRLRFNSVLDDPKAGFHTWLGVKFGFRRSASTIVEYKEFGDSAASCVEEGSFNLKPYAWAFQAGVGYGRFGLTGAFYCTSLFEEKQGPSGSDSLKPFSLGIYVDLL
ncbi:outer membrane beta-barrel protein [Cardinium endosymbiont of Dermatophagoides farinae]|nr:outer membrane beta-barrel protein [Cardinium endosymbiont of Dermatophagoides farinae]